MLLEQLKSEKGFTNHEKDVVRYILENLDRIPEMSAGAFTSKATVVRLGKKLGLSGYQEFRIKLVTEINQTSTIIIKQLCFFKPFYTMIRRKIKMKGIK